jgi:hypothetical protein
MRPEAFKDASWRGRSGTASVPARMIAGGNDSDCGVHPEIRSVRNSIAEVKLVKVDFKDDVVQNHVSFRLRVLLIVARNGDKLTLHRA